MYNFHRKSRLNRGFTLMELLVVLLIVLLVSAATLPTILPALNHRQVSEGARILHATLAGARDAAIRANAPRGIRLLPDPVFSGPNPLTPAIPGTLAANRMVMLEAAPDYTSGQVALSHVITSLGGTTFTAQSPTTGITQTQQIIVTEVITSSLGTLNEPTSWYWNIRQGEKIRFESSGVSYTIVGPMAVGPAGGNNERYINNGPPVNLSAVGFATRNPEFLILTNGFDDDGNGIVDESFDGIDNDNDTAIDPAYNGVTINLQAINPFPLLLAVANNSNNVKLPGEYEPESVKGALIAKLTSVAAVLTPQTPTAITSLNYSISRRPVVSESSREVALPQGVVIDMTTWNIASFFPNLSVKPVAERSRLPIDPFTYYVDIMIYPNGQVVVPGTGQGSLPTAQTSISSIPFYHFWIAERDDVFDPVSPGRNLIYPFLPMPQGAPGFTGGPSGNSYLKGDRRLVSLNIRTGQVTTSEIETSGTTGNIGYFDMMNSNAPYQAAQFGIREIK